MDQYNFSKYGFDYYNYLRESRIGSQVREYAGAGVGAENDMKFMT